MPKTCLLLTVTRRGPAARDSPCQYPWTFKGPFVDAAIVAVVKNHTCTCRQTITKGYKGLVTSDNAKKLKDKNMCFCRFSVAFLKKLF